MALTSDNVPQKYPAQGLPKDNKKTKPKPPSKPKKKK